MELHHTINAVLSERFYHFYQALLLHSATLHLYHHSLSTWFNTSLITNLFFGIMLMLNSCTIPWHCKRYHVSLQTYSLWHYFMLNITTFVLLLSDDFLAEMVTLRLGRMLCRKHTATCNSCCILNMSKDKFYLSFIHFTNDKVLQ